MSDALADTRRGWLGTAANALLAVVLAPGCAACRVPLDHPLDGVVCATCWEDVKPFSPPLCSRCGEMLPSWRGLHADGHCVRCHRTAGAIAAARCIGSYEGVLQSIVQALKYGGRRSLARPLADRMRGAAGALLADVDVVVPVPLHRRRRRQRGFNQADDLARALGLPVLPALRRIRPTASQTGLSAVQRRSNVRGAFAPVSRADVRGRCVLLVDDVRTTGATTEACAGVLLERGAREVRLLTAASVRRG